VTSRCGTATPKTPVNILTLETTCDETAAAVVTDRLEVLASLVASQDALHERFGGVVPEIASRAHVERILPVIDETLRRAGLSLDDLDAVAVANTPGLAGSLLVGLVAAKTLCLVANLPLVAVNHLQAHIYACRLAGRESGVGDRESGIGDRESGIGNRESGIGDRESGIGDRGSGVGAGQSDPHCPFPCVGLIVSGGHTSLYRCDDPLTFDLLGATIDDAAGEAFDKVAAMLSLPYPGGPAIQRAAEAGNPNAYRLPRGMLKDRDRLDFSFSGLKTAVRYRVTAPGKADFSKIRLPERTVADLAASFQEAVVDCLVGKALLALRKTALQTLCVGGGVAANARLRQRLAEEARRQEFQLHIAPLRLCTDNAVMGAIAVERLRAGLVEELELDVFPGVVRR